MTTEESKQETDPGWRGFGSIFNTEIVNAVVNQFQTFNRVQSSERWLDPRRSVNFECGYKDTIEPGDYHYMYRRDPIARRVTQVLPRETWQVQPVIYESEDPDVTTAFEEKFIELGDNLRGETSYYRGDEGNPLIEYFYRADVEAGKGRYSLLFMGVDDDGDLSQPVTKANKLLYLRVFSEVDAPIKDLETEHGPRYGQPLTYNVNFNNPDSYNTSGTRTIIGPDIKESEKVVHWSRVIHIADNLEDNEIFGTPRMEPVWDRLQDLRKEYGGSAEMYWKAGFGGFAFELAPGLDPREVKIDKAQFRDDTENFLNSQQKAILLLGLQAKSLAPQLVDPTPWITVQLQAIAMELGIPMRILMGSERGQLASGQDAQAWNDRLKTRQNLFVTPRILIPFIDRLISFGILPSPSKPKRSKFARKTTFLGAGSKTKSTGGYTIWWPDMTSQTDQEKANNAFKLAQALAVYSEKAVQWVFPPRQFFNIVVGLSEEEARGVYEASLEYNKENNHVPVATPVDPTNPSTTKPATNGSAIKDGNKPTPLPRAGL